ncbi:MAG: xanthine dehydrogenase accessory protein XdhC [Betaproteobacteria bacterium]|nr:xanthine dehydrogenase accessory protein XdhC [Betaproteobacteria bacterium]
MPRYTAELWKQLQHASGVLVTVVSVEGSGPREVGAWMAVFPHSLVNTIGGGHLEFQAIAEARSLIGSSRQEGTLVNRYALGPALGQCCGGVVHLKFEHIAQTDMPLLQQRLPSHAKPVALFGGGHVGHALVNVLSTLPFEVQWIDSRNEIFPSELPANVLSDYSDPVHAAVDGLPSGACVLIMSFSHAEDLDVVAACLKRQRLQGDLKFVGLIGSKTKWATFQHRLEAKGFSAQELAFITCPIGVEGITGKEPEVIAVAVAAQLLQLDQK